MNAVIYARYSSHSQQEQSIEGQLHDGRAWAEQNGYTVVAEYIDRALSGTKDTRPDFQRMIEDAARRQFGAIIVWKLDRFARNRYDSAIYKARLKKYGVKVVSVKENITDAPEGIILEGMLEAMAEYYSANLAQNIRRGQRESIANGHFCGGPVPYGYRVQDKKLVADEAKAMVVREIFGMYADGVPMKKIIDALSARGVTGRQGKPLTYHAFSHMLSNTTYIGQFKYAGQVSPGLAERIIDDDLFRRAQERLKLNARKPAAAKAKVEYLLTGKVFCGHCGSTMAGESGRSHTGEVHSYYACHDKKKYHSCRKKNERKDFIEWYVVEQTMLYVLSPSGSSAVAKAVVDEYNKEFSDSRVADMEKAVARVDRDLDKLVDALIDAPRSARERINSRIESLEAQKADLEADLARLRVAAGIRLTEAEVIAWLKKFADGDPMDIGFRRRIIDVFVNSVFLYDDRIITFYNIRGGKQVSYLDLPHDLPSSSDPSPGSDLKANAPLIAFKSEPEYIFVKGIFGCVFHRYEDEK